MTRRPSTYSVPVPTSTESSAVVGGRVLATFGLERPDDGPWPYAVDEEGVAGIAAEVPLVEYHDWANRGPSTMRVWVPLV